MSTLANLSRPMTSKGSYTYKLASCRARGGEKRVKREWHGIGGKAYFEAEDFGGDEG